MPLYPELMAELDAIKHDRVGGLTQVLEKIGAGERNRTVVISLEGCCSTIELHPRERFPD